jgi:hypothetical protein
MFDEAVATLRSWLGEPVTIVLEPDGTVMHGMLSELDAAGVDGAMFAVDADHTARGVAVTLFRDSVDSSAVQDGELVVQQGRVTVRVRPGA